VVALPTAFGFGRRNGASLLAAFAVLAAIAGSCRTAPTLRPIPSAPSSVPPVASSRMLESQIPAPAMRVGILTGVARVSVSADAGVLVYPEGASTEPGKDAVKLPRATFLPRAAGQTPPPRYRLQLASLRDEGAAQEIVRKIQEGLHLPTDARWSEETKTFQVRAGSWTTREQAEAQMGCFHPYGFAKPWVVEEAQVAAADGRVQLLEASRDLGVVTLVPARADQFLSVDGMEYRGLVEIRPDETGGITVVNIVNLEEYLRGVVPNELSPSAYPQIEALKAQAVAARTYAIRNRGQYQARGYDICATQACQVYRGKSTEQALSTQAVDDTRGIIAASADGPINALYTSTCGGHTEDGENMFEGEGASYLKGVACLPERTLWASVRTARTPRRLGQEEGLGRDVALLVALDVADSSLYSPAVLKNPAGEDELRGWTTRLMATLRRRPCSSPIRSITRRGAYFRHLVESLCWNDREKRLLGPEDTDYLLQLDDRAKLSDADERAAAAVLLQEGVLSPFEDNTLRPAAPVTRAEALHLLAGVAAKAGEPAVQVGLFKEYDDGKLYVARKDETSSFAIQPNLWLFRALDGTHLGTSELSLTAGDKVSLVLRDDQVVFLEAEQSRMGAAADRASRYYRWEVRMTPDEVARSIERYGNVGRVLDIVPQRMGVSGRVVDMTIHGTAGELPLKGLKIRWALGLRENLFVVDRERDGKGAVTRFIITGKGWGHGVGLCQVGASGMAQAGATYEQILQHYYTGITLKKMAVPASARAS
jgi:stage II sporulation protein D